MNASGFKLNFYSFICGRSITDLVEIYSEGSGEPLL